MNEHLFFEHVLLSYCSQKLVNQSWRAGFSTVSTKITLLKNIAAGLDGGKLTAATCMPLQALFLDEMIDNDTELIALNSNDNEIFNLISLRRNHKNPRYTDLQHDLQFRHHFRLSRPTVEQLCSLLGNCLDNCPQVRSEFNYITGRPPIQLRKQVSMIRKSQFCVLRSLK